MNLSGTLSDWTVADLLNMLNVTGKTASLHVRGERSGAIHFSQGKVVGASIVGDSVNDNSRVAVADALLVLSALDRGSFDLGPFEGPDGDGWDIDSLLSDLDRLETLQADLVESGLNDSRLMLREEVDQPVTIQTEDWWAIASLVSVLSFQQLEEVFGRGRAIRLLHALWRMDLVELLEIPAEKEPILADAEPVLTELDSEPNTDVQPGADPEPETESSADEESRDDESWLDEIAAAAGAGQGEDGIEPLEPRRVLGVAAPASTVLTGSVLDEMRRLRSHPGD